MANDIFLMSLLLFVSYDHFCGSYIRRLLGKPICLSLSKYPFHIQYTKFQENERLIQYDTGL